MPTTFIFKQGHFLGWLLSFAAGLGIGLLLNGPEVTCSNSVETAAESPAVVSVRTVATTARKEVTGNEPLSSTKSPEEGPFRPVESEERAQVPQPSSDNSTFETKVRWRISSIEKFVTVSDEQRERLEKSFISRAKGDTPDETMEEILGEEKVELYRSQVRAAFQRAAQENREKEIYYISRKLGLGREQEQALTGVYENLDADSHVPLQEGDTRAAEVKDLVTAEKRKQEILLSKAREFLTKDQFEAFTALVAESAGSDMQVFHSAGPTPSATPK